MVAEDLTVFNSIIYITLLQREKVKTPYLIGHTRDKVFLKGGYINDLEMLCCSKQPHFYAILEIEWGKKMQSSISHLVIEPFILYLDIGLQKWQMFCVFVIRTLSLKKQVTLIQS